MKPLRLLRSILTFALLSIASAAQNHPDAPTVTNADAPTGVMFSSQAELVSIPVVVTGKKKAHITGLRQSDFSIEEDGQKREIATFEEITADSVAKPEPAQLFPLSNFATSGREHELVTILVVDLLNTPFLAQANARSQLLKFLRSNVSSRGPTELTVITSRGLRLVHSFTTDPAILIAAINKLESETGWRDEDTHQLIDLSPDHASNTSMSKDSMPLQPAFTEATALQRAMAERSDSEFAYYRQREDTLITLAALEQLAQSAAGIPGRKSLIWLTGGLPFFLSDPNDPISIDSTLMGNYESGWRALNDANVAVYPIDARGLYPPGVTAQSSLPPVHTNEMNLARPRIGSAISRLSSDNLLDSLRNFAGSTGGQICYNRNDLDECVALACKDSLQYYMLGYYLPRDDRKTGWRKLKVRVSPAHKEVRARNAVYVGDAKVEDSRSIEQQLEFAFSSPVNYSGVPLGLKFGEVKPADTAHRAVGFAVFLQPNGFATENNWIRLHIQFVATDERNRSTLVFNNTFKAHLKPEATTDLIQNGFNYTGNLILAPGPYQLKLLVRDDLSRKIGSVQAPFLVK